MFARPLAATTNSATATAIPSERDVDAHLSEGIPRFWLLNNTALETFVDNELRFGLQVAVEAKVLADINGTSGIQTQPYATSVLATLRKGLTKLETAGYAAGSIVLHPTDWEGVELALSSQPPSSTCACRTTRPPGGCSASRVATVKRGGRGRARAGDGRRRGGHRHPRRRRAVVGERDRGLVRQEPRVRPLRITLCDKRVQPARRGHVGPGRVTSPGPRPVFQNGLA